MCHTQRHELYSSRFLCLVPRAFLQVLPVLEQQLEDVKIDLENQEGQAKELNSQVNIRYSVAFCIHVEKTISCWLSLSHAASAHIYKDTPVALSGMPSADHG